MFLTTTGLIALSRKVGDERARKKETKAQLLEAPDVEGGRQSARLQYGSQLESGPCSRYTGSSPTNLSTRALRSSQGEHDRDPLHIDQDRRQNDHFLSPISPSSVRSPASSRWSNDDPDSKSISSGAPTVMNDQSGPLCVRIRTQGSALNSGFAYHPSLFDLHVSPALWERFTAQVLEACKFGVGDMAQMWTAATATALTGAMGTSIMVGRSVNRSIQEKKVKVGRENMEDGGLGSILKRWNETEFHDLGLFVHLDLSQSARKRQEQNRNPLRKPTLLYSKREDRERKTEERKFCITVTKLDEERLVAHAIDELAEENAVLCEAPNEESEISELPGEHMYAAELPGDPRYGNVKYPTQYGEPGRCAMLEPKELYGDKFNIPELPARSDEDLWPQPLVTHGALDKEFV